jgi:PAS domain S-box-containing protein
MPDLVKGSRARDVFRYGYASAAVVAALLVRQALVQYLGVELPPFLLFYPTLLVVALLAGLWPGVLATLLSALLTHYWIFRERGYLATAGGADTIVLAIFIVMGVLVCVVAERYRQVLLHEERRFRSIFENMAEGMAYCKMLLDDEGRAVDFVYLEVNHAFNAMTGLKNVEGKRLSQVVPNMNQVNPELLETYGRVVRTGQSERFEIYREPLGKWFSILAYCTKKKYFVVVLQDITEHKRAEERIAHLASFPEMNPGFVFETDLEGKLTYFNPAVARQFPTLSDAEVEHPLLQDWAAVISSLKANADRPIWREVATDGMTVLQTVGYVAKFAVIRAYCIDITGHKQAELEAAKLQAQLQQSQKLEAVGQLAGGIAHDFNNLLMVIMAQTELLGLEVKGTAAKRVKDVMKSARRAAELTGQLLAFSRKQPSQPMVTSMNRLVGGMSDMLQRLVGENLDFTVALCDGPWMVKIDRPQFEQVMMNLVVNARDAMPEGGRLTIETANVTIHEEYIATHSLVPAGDYAMLAVTDSGMGMSAETQSHLFEPFFTTKEPGKGTGLGLSMVYGIVKQNGGFIWVYSEPGKGTCLKIYLPKAKLNEAALPEGSAPPIQSIKKRATILLVEDEDSLRNVISEFLRLEGHTVIAAGTVEEACRSALDGRTEIELLLTDVVLKGGNGKQLVHRLEEQGCVFPVIYMSGYMPNDIEHRGGMEPGTLFLQKPFSRLRLLDKVEEALTARG